MPYWLYKRAPGKHQAYEQQHEIPLFGYKEGLIYHAVKSELPKALKANKRFFRTRTISDLLSARDYDPDIHAVVINFTPKRPDQQILGVIRDIAGHTDETWTPLIILCAAVERKPSATKSLNFKETDFEDAHSRCCTVLYAHGGWQGGKEYGTWISQGRGGLAAAILWPSAFEHITNAGLAWIQSEASRAKRIMSKRVSLLSAMKLSALKRGLLPNSAVTDPSSPPISI